MAILRTLLREKWWFRAVKVFYILGLCLFALLALAITYDNADDYVCPMRDVVSGFRPDCYSTLDTGSFLISAALGLATLWVAAYLSARIFFFVVCNEGFWKRPRGIFDF